MDLKITIISDDKTRKSRLQSKHSMSLLIERGAEVYLFGLGVDPLILEHNTQVLGLSLDFVDYGIISHEHTPHYGGYKYLAQESPFTIVYIPFGSMESLGSLLKNSGLRPREVTKWTSIEENVYISRPYYGPPYEHLLVFNEPSGLIVVTGCLHPGIEPLRDVVKTFNRRIRAIIGGFHLSSAPSSVVKEFAERLVNEIQPEIIVPLHCSGQELVKFLTSLRRVEVIEAGAGDTITV